MTWQRWRQWNLHPWGLICGTIGFALGLTPSLLPRTFFYQGLISGMAAALGYGIGVFLHLLWDLWLRERLRPHLEPRLHQVPAKWRDIGEVTLNVLSLLALLGMVLFSLRWQRGIAELTGSQAYSLWEFLLVLPIGLGLWLLLVLLSRGIRWLTRKGGGMLLGWLPSYRVVASWLLTAIIGVFLVEQVIPGTIVRGAETLLANGYQNAEPGDVPPTVPERSGSPESLAEWEGLGRYGMRFLNQGLHREELAELTGEPAEEPIRVYAGLDNAPTNAERAQLIIDEFLRTGATEREAIVMHFTTGTGWVNPQAAQAFELMYGGDTAYAAVQYSYLPSPVHFLAGGDEVNQAGRELITPVIDWWNTLPADTRPKLYLYGESLGSTGVEAAFSGIRDIANSVDGILLTGPPNFNSLWRAFVDRRDPGSSEVLPEYGGGTVVRFAENEEQIRNYAYGDYAWGPTRVLYIQHPSDPVVWWSPKLILREPDWLDEQPGFDRLPAMTWMPLITFLQVSADLPMAQAVPDGHGHNYGDAMLDGWAAIAGEDSGFSVPQIQELKPLLEQALDISGDREDVVG
ncbi:hypothetical protein COCCU_04210 [Corynebacterium occultum]|uniref:Alpha/beta-hydrolase family protein n=1 Tax=Corynebacterium occultum TaxID=2675219 RepID=A0A6B8W9W6_9CORY|nr:alpha/beta hydrolase [Corynebacterium occultum]QGU06790.1 hypothetical protein COCCU_04210 [Corynebacterium occultum]